MYQSHQARTTSCILYMGSEQERVKVTREIKVAEAEAEISLCTERLVDVMCVCLAIIGLFVFVVNCMLIFLQGITPTTFSFRMAPEDLIGCPGFPHNSQRGNPTPQPQ